jgi:hypothetical protein
LEIFPISQVNFSTSLDLHQIYSLPGDEFVTRKRGGGSMNTGSVKEDGAGSHKLPPNEVSHDRVTGGGWRPAKVASSRTVAGDAFAGFGVDSRSDWVRWANALSGQ